MKLRRSIEIAASAEQVWPLLADPALWDRWNQKLLSVTRGRQGVLIPGEQFSAVFQMKRRKSDTEIHVKQAEPGRLLVMRQHFYPQTRMQALEITFKIEPSRLGVRVCKTMDFSEARIPLVFRILISVVYRLGRPVGKDPLHELKQSAEIGSASLRAQRLAQAAEAS